MSTTEGELDVEVSLEREDGEVGIPLYLSGVIVNVSLYICIQNYSGIPNNHFNLYIFKRN